MSQVFLFDLDSTITKQEILPEISKVVGKEDEMQDLTERTMLGEFPFKESFSARVKLLQDIPVSQVSQIVQNVLLNPKIVDFLTQHHDQCYVVTGNLDVWISGLLQKLGMIDHVFCSKALVENDKITKITQIVAKEDAITSFADAQIIAIGDGSNDRDLLKLANIGIAFGGVRPIAPALFDVCDYAIYTEDKLCELLQSILEVQHD